jgi:PAS domain S-box-containing protein
MMQGQGSEVEWEESARGEIDQLAGYLDRFSMVQTREELAEIAREIFEMKLPSEYTGLYFWNEKENRLKMIVGTGFTEEEKAEAERTAMDRHVGKVYQTGKPIWIDDTDSPDSGFWIDSKRSFHVRTRLVMPVISINRTVGVFIIASSRPNRFTDYEKSVFSFICKIAGFVYFRLAQLEKSEEQNRKLADLALIATKTSNNVIIADKEGRIEWVNEAFTQQTGYTLDEAIGKIPGRLLRNTESSEEQRRVLRMAVLLGRHTKTEVTNRTKSGRLYTNEIDITPIRNEKGELIKFISVQKDITERKQFVEEINESSRQLQIANTRLETIARFSGIGIWESDLSNNTGFWSDKAFDVFGVPPTKITNQYQFWKDLIHPEDKVRIVAEVEVLFNSTEPVVEHNYRSLDSEGNVRYIRGLTYLEKDKKGNNLRVVGSVVNITKDVLAAEILAASEAKYREIFSNNVAGVFRTTLGGKIIDVNRAFLNAFGYEKEELLEKGLKVIYFSEEERQAYLADLKEKGRLENYFLRTRHKSGRAVELLANVRLIDTGGENAYLEGTLIDITEIRQAERRIKSSEELFRSIFDTSLAGVFLKNSKGILVDGNQAAREILGINSAWGGSDSEFSAFLQNQEEWQNMKKDLLAGKNPGSFRLKIRSKDGLLKYVLLTCNPVTLEQFGKCLLFTVIDVTETERLNEELVVSERRYRDLFENSLEIIQSFGPDGKLNFCNKKWFEILKYSPEEVQNLNLFDIISPKDKEHCKALFRRVLSGKSVQNIEVSFVGKDGRETELSGNVVPIFKDGRMISTHAFFRDVSIENMQRHQLDMQRKFYERVLENLPAEISILDAEMRYLYSNPLSITGGLPRAEALGKTLFNRTLELGRSEDDARRRQAYFEQAHREKRIITFEETLKTANGSYKTILRRFFPVFKEDGRLDLMISVGSDITELEENRKQLTENNEELRKLNHELDRFVYSVSHDLRAPIASMKALLSLMSEKDSEEELKETYISMMSTVAERMDNVIFEILDYSRNSRLDVVSEEIDLEKLIRSAVETYRHFSALTVHFQFESFLKKPLYSDSRRLQSVINNLISNAIKYSQKGKKDIEIRVELRENGHFVEMKVSDNGEGIRAEFLPRIFDMFYRASNTSSGSGLGLYICSEILKKMKGSISVQSSEGQGTAFTVLIPNFAFNE